MRGEAPDVYTIPPHSLHVNRAYVVVQKYGRDIFQKFRQASCTKIPEPVFEGFRHVQFFKLYGSNSIELRYGITRIENRIRLRFKMLDTGDLLPYSYLNASFDGSVQGDG